MSNSFIMPSVVAKAALIVLENNCVLASLVHRGYESEYQAGRGATVTVRRPTTFTSSAFTTTVAVQSAAESSVQVVLDTLLDVSFEVGTKELTLDVKDFTEQLLVPAMRAHVQKVDELIAAHYVDAAGAYEVSSTPVIGDIAKLDEIANILKWPNEDRRLVLSPKSKASYIGLDAFVHADKRGDGGRAMNRAEIGHVMNFDTYMDQNMKTHTIDATLGDLAGAMKGAVAAAATACTIDALTDDDVINAGDVFVPTGSDYYYTIRTAGTVATNEIVTTFEPPMVEALLDNCVVTFQGTHKASMAFHKNFLALVTAPLRPPMGGALAATASRNGLSCRVVYDYNSSTKVNSISVDMLMGTKVLDSNLGARLFQV